MLVKLFNFLFGDEPVNPEPELDLGAFFAEHVAFYQQLDAEDREEFERRCLAFLNTTRVHGEGVVVSDADRLLVAASAIIPVWAFPRWHYFNLREVLLVGGNFNTALQLGEFDSYIRGMVGTGALEGRMVLSQPALHHGFRNSRDKRNVGIHEFSHLVDMADGVCDGLPRAIADHTYALPWLELVATKIAAIDDTNIDTYGASNEREFFAVVSEYFFERPKMLKRKHPRIYEALEAFYQQDLTAIEADIAPRRQGPCPCGSGRKYKRCCEPKA